MFVCVVVIDFSLLLVCSVSKVNLSVCLKDGIGLDAINDSFLLEGSIYRLLRRHCREQPYYVHLLELFTEVLYVLIDYTGTHIHTHTHTLTQSISVSDFFPDRARPSFGPHDGSPRSDWSQQIHNGKVAKFSLWNKSEERNVFYLTKWVLLFLSLCLSGIKLLWNTRPPFILSTFQWQLQCT